MFCRTECVHVAECVGAGGHRVRVGGAFVMAMQVAATTWGPSGLLGVFTMTAGPNAGIKSVIYYLIGLIISCGMAFLITGVRINDQEVEAA